MATRAMWKAVLSFGGIKVPVKLYSAVTDKDVAFRLLHAKDMEPVRQRMVSAKSGDEVPRDALQRGVEVEPGTFVLVTQDDLDGLAPKESHTITIERFVDPAKIDHPWYERAYYLGPDGAAEDYWALTEALEKQGRQGIARWVMRKKSYAGALSVHRGQLVLISLRFAEEIVSADDLEAPSGRALDAKEVAMAGQLVGMLAGRFRADDYHDSYRESVLELIRVKASGGRPKKKRVAKKHTPSSLAGALQASLKAAKGARHAQG